MLQERTFTGGKSASQSNEIVSDEALFRGEQRSRMRMTLAPRVERAVLEEKNLKESPNVRLHPIFSPTTAPL